MEFLDYNAARFWFAVLQWVFTGMVALVVFWLARTRAKGQALQALNDRIDDNARRLDMLERDMRDAPGHSDFQDLRESLSGLRAEVRQMTGTMQGLGRAVDLMTEHLINKGSKG